MHKHVSQVEENNRGFSLTKNCITVFAVERAIAELEKNGPPKEEYSSCFEFKLTDTARYLSTVGPLTPPVIITYF